MIKALKQTHIISLIKLFVLSFIFCLPQAPANFEQDYFVSHVTQSKINPFILPSNVHFEHKVLKKIPLIETPLPLSLGTLQFHLLTLESSTPDYTHSKTSHFITSSYARGPPIRS